MNDERQAPSLELPNRWSWAELGEIATFINGDRGKNYPSQSDRVTCGVPFINTGHIEPTGRLRRERMDYITRDRFEKLGSGKVKVGDIVYCLRGSTIGKIARNHFPEGAIASSLIIIRAKTTILQDFIYHYLASPIGQSLAKKFDNGSAQPNLSARVLSKYPIPLPPEAELHSICQVLDALDDKIELNRRMNETLEAMAREVFKDWFVDFGPTRAKAEGRPPYLASETWDVFPDSLDDEEKPVGWNLRELGELASLTKGRSYKSAELHDSTIALVTLKSFERGGGYRDNGLKPFTGKYSPEQVVAPGELVTALTDVTQAADVIGKPAIVLEDDRYETLVASLDVGIIRPRGNRVGQSFIAHLMQTEQFQNHIYAHCTGTTVLHLSKEAFPTFRVCLPPMELAVRFERIVAPISVRIATNARESKILAQTRDLLLPKLLSGEIRFADAEKAVEAVA